MPLNKRNTTVFHRTLYAGELVTVTLLKRNDDQDEGTVTPYLIFQSRRSIILKQGEPYQGDMSSDHDCVWHLPRVELDRVGVNYLSAADGIVDEKGRVWQNEADIGFEVKLFENHVCMACKRADFTTAPPFAPSAPPAPSNLTVTSDQPPVTLVWNP